MGWYRTGTITVTNGNAVVTGAGTYFVENVGAGEAMLGPDGRLYEIASVQSATQLTLASVYQGASAGGQGYAILPTQSFARDLALGAAQLLNTFGAVRDGIGQGLIADGTAAAPGIRFTNDLDTGLRRVDGNVLSLVTGGVNRVTVFAETPTEFFNGLRASSAAALGNGVPPGTISYEHPTTRIYVGDGTGYGFSFSRRTGGATTDLLTVSDSGNLLVGVAGGGQHRINRGASEGGAILTVGGNTVDAVAFFSVAATGVNAANSAMAVQRNSTTNRSINAAGTVNASGADYAEYMTKAAGCGTIAPGDVCGVDSEGRLTRTWADAVSFVIKSTDPAYVGGDTWAAELAPKPEQDENEADQAFAGRLREWEAALEAERQKVDRIAFAGQVPVNVSGPAEPGDYLIAAASGAGIEARAVPAADITFDQYRRRLGKVWAIRDGRPWVDLQHG